MSSERLWSDGGIADQIQAAINDETAALRARLAEVEAERDELAADIEALRLNFTALVEHAEAAEARLAAVLALCCNCTFCSGIHMLEPSRVRAAAAGDPR